MPSLKSCSIQAMLALATSTSALPTLQKRAQAAANLCDMPDESLILTGTPWIVYNMMYNSAQIEGTACTGYVGTTTDANGNPAVKWNSTMSIEYVESTNNVPKGYSFVGLTQNLENRISDIGSIPTTYEWTRTNTTAYKGNVCYDFMTSDTKGDSTSSNAQELMLWLQYEGGQLPIGWADGAVATIDSLYGTSWKLYQGKNTDTGITVSSLLPDTQFTGSFSGDIKDWLSALVTQGVFTDSTYVNVGNAGTEPFYGDAVFEATLGLQVNVGSSSVTPVSSVTPSTTAAPSSTQVPVSTEAPASTEVPASSTSAVAINIPSPSSSSSSVIVESTPTTLATSATAATTTPAASSSTAVDGASASSSSVVEAPAPYPTSPAASPSSSSSSSVASAVTTPVLSTPVIPTTSAADSPIPTGESSGNGAAAPTPGSDAGVSGEYGQGQGQGQGLEPAEGEEDGPCAVEYIYI